MVENYIIVKIKLKLKTVLFAIDHCKIVYVGRRSQRLHLKETSLF